MFACWVRITLWLVRMLAIPGPSWSSAFTKAPIRSCGPASRCPEITSLISRRRNSRIVANGGRVACFKDARNKAVGPSRVWLKNSQVPGLAMSRSFGDEVATWAGVIHKPEIFHFPLSGDDRAIVLASDGVWEFLSNKQVTKLLAKAIKARKPRQGCERVVTESVRLWKLRDSIIDDITVVVVILPEMEGKEVKGVSSSLSLNRYSSW